MRQGRVKMDHNDKILRLRSLIDEYDDNEDHHRNPNSAAFDVLAQKIKVILNAGTEMTPKDGAIDASSGSNRHDCAAVSSSFSGLSSQPQLIDVDSSKSNANGVAALENHDVLTEILNWGSYCDLNNFRLVNKQWKGVANSTIIIRRLWELKFKGKFSGGFSLVNGLNGNTLLYDVSTKLCRCVLAPRGSFPLTTLDFSGVWYYYYLNCSPFSGFYTLMGQSIKRVVFNNFGPLTVNEFQDLLVNKILNVDHIDAGKIILHNKGDSPLSLDLPNLKTIRFISKESGESFEVEPYYKDLLLAARNLKEIQGFHIQLANIVMETGKMSCIQKLNFDLKLVTCSVLYVQFSYFEPKLTSLVITAGGYFRSDRIKLAFGQSLKKISSMFRNYKGLRWLKILFNHPCNVDFRMFRTLESWEGKTCYTDHCEFECRDGKCTNNYSDDDDEDVPAVTPVITPVSCVYGFSLMPNLEQVIIGYDHTLPNASEIAQVFEPFAEFPYVKIVHEPTNWNDYRE